MSMKKRILSILLSMVLLLSCIPAQVLAADTDALDSEFVSGEQSAAEETAAAANGWISQNGSWYYYENGTRVTGWLSWNDSWYYLNASGVMQTGWVKDRGSWYYLYSNGKMATGWLKDNGHWFYLKQNGAMMVGWLKWNGSWYYLKSVGGMATGWLQDGGHWFYLNEKGAMVTGWLKWNGSWYYLKTAGGMATGWISYHDSRYYLGSNGAMQTGLIRVDGSEYYLQANGALFSGGAFSLEETAYASDGNGVVTEIAAYSNSPYAPVNGNTPYFTEAEKTVQVFETYSALDSLGRCGQAYAAVCTEIMPTESRGAIGSVKPTGWHSVKYPGIVSGNYLYNRCHLIAFELAGENANEQNLITGTRYLNISGMLPFENMVADYVKETENHVLYRVTPVFDGDDLVARGVLIEAWSVEDEGDGICFNVFCYNVQPGITIDYATGDSCEASADS